MSGSNATASSDSLQNSVRRGDCAGSSHSAGEHRQLPLLADAGALISRWDVCAGTRTSPAGPQRSLADRPQVMRRTRAASQSRANQRVPRSGRKRVRCTSAPSRFEHCQSSLGHDFDDMSLLAPPEPTAPLKTPIPLPITPQSPRASSSHDITSSVRIPSRPCIIYDTR